MLEALSVFGAEQAGNANRRQQVMKPWRGPVSGSSRCGEMLCLTTIN
jgi:hypothetical protein